MRLWLAMGVLLVVAACGTSDPPERSPASTPARTATSAPALEPAAAAVDALMRALDAGDCKAARKLVVTPTELGCDVVEQSKDSFADEGIDLDEVTYRVGTVHDASATVSVTWGNDYPAESYDVQRIGSRWKVVFDSAA